MYIYSIMLSYFFIHFQNDNDNILNIHLHSHHFLVKIERRSPILEQPFVRARKRDLFNKKF